MPVSLVGSRELAQTDVRLQGVSRDYRYSIQLDRHSECVLVRLLTLGFLLCKRNALAHLTPDLRRVRDSRWDHPVLCPAKYLALLHL